MDPQVGPRSMWATSWMKHDETWWSWTMLDEWMSPSPVTIKCTDRRSKQSIPEFVAGICRHSIYIQMVKPAVPEKFVYQKWLSSWGSQSTREPHPTAKPLVQCSSHTSQRTHCAPCLRGPAWWGIPSGIAINFSHESRGFGVVYLAAMEEIVKIAWALAWAYPSYRFIVVGLVFAILMISLNGPLLQPDSLGQRLTRRPRLTVAQWRHLMPSALQISTEFLLVYWHVAGCWLLPGLILHWISSHARQITPGQFDQLENLTPHWVPSSVFSFWAYEKVP